MLGEDCCYGYSCCCYCDCCYSYALLQYSFVSNYDYCNSSYFYFCPLPCSSSYSCYFYLYSDRCCRHAATATAAAAAATAITSFITTTATMLLITLTASATSYFCCSSLPMFLLSRLVPQCPSLFMTLVMLGRSQGLPSSSFWSHSAPSSSSL